MPAAPVILNNTPPEFLATEREDRQAALADAPWIRTVPLAHPLHALVYAGLDEGEAAVLVLAEELNGIVVMDERKGRRYATRLGLPLTGSLGLLLLAKERGLLSSVEDAITQLVAAGLHLDGDLIAKVLRMAGESDPRT